MYTCNMTRPKQTALESAEGSISSSMLSDAAFMWLGVLNKFYNKTTTPLTGSWHKLNTCININYNSTLIGRLIHVPAWMHLPRVNPCGVVLPLSFWKTSGVKHLDSKLSCLEKSGYSGKVQGINSPVLWAIVFCKRERREYVDIFPLNTFL